MLEKSSLMIDDAGLGRKIIVKFIDDDIDEDCGNFAKNSKKMDSMQILKDNFVNNIP